MYSDTEPEGLRVTLKRELNLPEIRYIGLAGKGCINEGFAYDTGAGKKIFVKINPHPEAENMFNGERSSLEAIRQTGAVRVPKPIKVMRKSGSGAVFAMEYIEMSDLERHSSSLGYDLARLHKHNENIYKEQDKLKGFVGKGQSMNYVDKFGFNCMTYCGYIPQENQWYRNWVDFFAGKLDFQLRKIEERYGDREVMELWSELKICLPIFFDGVDIRPALLHGDLHGLNAKEIPESAVIYDPAGFYGHSEYDLAITTMFVPFCPSFYESYYRSLPRCSGYKNRNMLYQLFHHFNHWNHFGPEKRDSSIFMMRTLLNNLSKKIIA